MNVEFASSWVLLLLLLVPLFVWWPMRKRRRGAVTYSSRQRLAGIRVSLRRRLLWLIPMLRAVGLACLIVAMARPRQGIGEVRTSAEGIAIMFVVDRSWSMSEVLDRQRNTSRMDVVKEVCKEFVEGDGHGLAGRRDDLIGLVTFGRFAQTVCPLVRIHDTLVQLVEGIELANPQSMDAGTAIGEGLALAAARLKDAENDLKKRNETEDDPEFALKSKVIVLLTDGDENVTSIRAEQAAALCAEWGIRVYAIGIGEPQLRRRRGGLNQQLLDRIAEQTSGISRIASDPDALHRIYEEIDQLEKSRIRSKEFTSYDERFAVWAITGGGVLALQMLLAGTWLRRLP